MCGVRIGICDTLLFSQTNRYYFLNCIIVVVYKVCEVFAGHNMTVKWLKQKKTLILENGSISLVQFSFFTLQIMCDCTLMYGTVSWENLFLTVLDPRRSSFQTLLHLLCLKFCESGAVGFL